MTESITVDDLKAHLNITSNVDDALLAEKIEAAQECVFNFIGGQIDPAPAPVKEAVRQLAAHFYENREAVLIGSNAYPVPHSVFDLVGPYRSYVF